MKWMALVLVTVAAGHALLVSAQGHAPRPIRTASAFTVAGFAGVLTAKTGQEIKTASHYRQHYTAAIPNDQDQTACPLAGHPRTS